MIDMTEDKVILLIEDNPGDIDLTIRALEKKKILNKIVVAEDGEPDSPEIIWRKT